MPARITDPSADYSRQPFRDQPFVRGNDLVLATRFDKAGAGWKTGVKGHSATSYLINAGLNTAAISDGGWSNIEGNIGVEFTSLGYALLGHSINPFNTSDGVARTWMVLGDTDVIDTFSVNTTAQLFTTGPYVFSANGLGLGVRSTSPSGDSGTTDAIGAYIRGTSTDFTNVLRPRGAMLMFVTANGNGRWTFRMPTLGIDSTAAFNQDGSGGQKTDAQVGAVSPFEFTNITGNPGQFGVGSCSATATGLRRPVRLATCAFWAGAAFTDQDAVDQAEMLARAYPLWLPR